MAHSHPLIREILAAGPFVRSAAPFALVAVRGPDASDFLQRLCSQDVLALAADGAAPVAFLDGKGKLVATAIAARSGDGFLLETQAHQRAALLALLDRYHFTERLEFAAVPGACVERVAAAVGDGEWAASAAAGVTSLRCARHGVQFERWHGASGDALPAPQGAAMSDGLGECLRMVAGFVKVGVESEPTTLALEADLADHCSTTKGCYTGQEIVARIHTYGHTNRALCLLALSAGAAIAAPRVLLEPEDELQVGRVMHAVPVPGHDARLGVGYLPPDFQAIGTELLVEGGGAATVIGYGP